MNHTTHDRWSCTAQMIRDVWHTESEVGLHLRCFGHRVYKNRTGAMLDGGLKSDCVENVIETGIDTKLFKKVGHEA